MTFPNANPLTVSDLFTPASSGVGSSGVVPLSPPSGTWLSIELQVATDVQLPTTSWQSGAPERTILAINAVCASETDANISKFAQAQFLDSAATGTVTYQAMNGQIVTTPVTPDPSDPSQNPTGALGWLDLLAQSNFNVYRLPQSNASGPLAIANTKPVAIGPYVAGAYHVSNANTGAGYHNLASLSIPSSIIPSSGGVISGVSPSIASTLFSTTGPHGLTVGQVVMVNLPATSGITMYGGLPWGNRFGIVTGVGGSFDFTIGVGSAGTWTAGGQAYLCSIATMSADNAGIASNAGPGTVTNAVTQNTGVFVSNVLAWSASNWESNLAYVARVRLSFAAASPNGPSQAYTYFALSAASILAAETPSYTFTNGPITAATTLSSVSSGEVVVYVASATPQGTSLGDAITPGCAQDLVTNVVSSGGLCKITTVTPHGMTSGMVATITGILGVPVANGSNTITLVDASNFTIPVAFAGSYTGGGVVEGGDLGAVDRVLQQNCTPDGIISLAISAQAFPVAVVATVTVPKAYVATYQVAAVTQLQTYLSSLEIGGSTTGGVVPYDGIVGALEEAGVLTLGAATFVRGITGLTVNAVATDVSFPGANYRAILPLPSITVVGV